MLCVSAAGVSLPPPLRMSSVPRFIPCFFVTPWKCIADRDVPPNNENETRNPQHAKPARSLALRNLTYDTGEQILHLQSRKESLHILLSSACDAILG